MLLHTRQMIQPALSSHTVLPCLPHLRKRQADVQMLIVQSFRLIDSEWYQPIVSPKLILREREQKGPILICLVLLFLWFGRGWRRRCRCCRLDSVWSEAALILVLSRKLGQLALRMAALSWLYFFMVVVMSDWDG